MDWRNSVRAALHLKPAEDKAEADAGVRVLECVKNNYAPRGEAKRLEWSGGLLVPLGTASPIEQSARDAEADAKFLTLLRKAISLGMDVGPNPSSNYAPKRLAELPDAEGYTARGLVRSMSRLIEAGSIIVEEFGPPAKRRKRLVPA
jgi:hypothetical protein